VTGAGQRKMVGEDPEWQVPPRYRITEIHGCPDDRIRDPRRYRPGRPAEPVEEVETTFVIESIEVDHGVGQR
jgi:hypothetical protein